MNIMNNKSTIKGLEAFYVYFEIIMPFNAESYWYEEEYFNFYSTN